MDGRWRWRVRAGNGKIMTAFGLDFAVDEMLIGFVDEGLFQV